MKFTIAKSMLFNELSAAQSVAEKKSTIPVLSNVLLEAAGDDLTIKVTDLDVSLTSSCNADVKQEGAVCVPVKKLFEIVRSLPDGDIALALDKDRVKINSGSSRFTLASQATENFPEIKQHDGPWLQFPAEVIARLVGRTMHAITTEESRYALNGAKLEIGNGKARMVATDGHRLAFVERDGDFGSTAIDALILRKTLTELARLCANVDGGVEIALADNHFFFRSGSRVIAARTLMGQFPNYKLVLPKENNKRVIVERAALLSSVRRVALMADERSHAMRFTIADGAIKLEAQTSESGEASETISADYNGTEIVVGFNAKYVMDVLDVLDTVSVEIKLKDGNAQVEFNPVSEEGWVSRMVVMPVRL